MRKFYCVPMTSPRHSARRSLVRIYELGSVTDSLSIRNRIVIILVGLVHPVLAVEDAGHHHRTRLIAHGVDGGGRGIDDGSDDLDDRQCRGRGAVVGDDVELERMCSSEYS